MKRYIVYVYSKWRGSFVYHADYRSAEEAAGEAVRLLRGGVEAVEIEARDV